MIISIHQPDFIPWTGFFDKIKRSNKFYFLDDVQFARRGWTNRDKIIINSSQDWLTVPVIKKGSFNQLIRDVKIDSSLDWKKKHLNTIKFNYKKTLNFPIFYDLLEEIYVKKFEFLIDFNLELISLILKILEINTQLFYSSDLNLKNQNSDKILSIVLKSKSKSYLTGTPSLDYLDLNSFKKNNINVIIHDFNVKEYQENYENFKKELSVVDYIFNGKKIF